MFNFGTLDLGKAIETKAKGEVGEVVENTRFETLT